jgi:hypothetical protein
VTEANNRRSKSRLATFGLFKSCDTETAKSIVLRTVRNVNAKTRVLEPDFSTGSYRVYPCKVADIWVEEEQGAWGTRIRTGIGTRNKRGFEHEQPEVP